MNVVSLDYFLRCIPAFHKPHESVKVGISCFHLRVFACLSSVQFSCSVVSYYIQYLIFYYIQCLIFFHEFIDHLYFFSMQALYMYFFQFSRRLAILQVI